MTAELRIEEMTQPHWLSIANKYLGVKEIKGPQHNPQILEFWKTVKLSGIKDDEVPWCAAFVGAVLELSGIRSTRADNARSYLNWGVALPEPSVGAIVVFQRDGGGHVGFIVGRDKSANLVVIGGNQGDKVSIAPFTVERVVGYRWPASGIENPPQILGFSSLPLILAKEPVSKDEA